MVTLPAFPRIRLHQMNLGHAQYREDEAGKAGAAAEVEQRPGTGRDKRIELRGIEHVTAPQIRQRIRPDEIDRPLPLSQELGVALEPRECFT